MRGANLGGNFAVMVVDCLHSSKVETRSAATSLMEASLSAGCVSPDSYRKTLGRLKPALQRTIGPLIEKHVKRALPIGQSDLSQDKDDAEIDSERPKAKLQQTRRNSTKHPAFANSSSADLQDDRGSNYLRHPMLTTTSVKIPEISDPWPEYPEEPNTNSIETLHVLWRPFLTSASALNLFPTVGIKKQDDAIQGCNLLKGAITWDLDNHEQIVIEILGFVLRWISIALCARETAQGLNIILSTIQDLLSYLGDKQYKLGESEITIIVPLLLEKASTAKVSKVIATSRLKFRFNQERFESDYSRILKMFRGESLVPPKEYGIFACSIVLERSSHVKVKTLACEMAKECVEAAGLSAIGKKGLFAAAKFLSEDPTRHRSAPLELLVEVTVKMKNDVSKVARICGSNLSDKARQKLEERLKEGKEPTKRKLSHGKGSSVVTELPRLSLRTASPSKRALPAVEEAPDDIFVFSTKLSSDSGDPLNTEREVDPIVATLGTSSAAASLRARLQKIREKGLAVSVEQDLSPPVVEKHSIPIEENETQARSSNIEPINVYIERFASLLDKKPPVDESDEDIELAINGLRIFHTVLAGKDGSFFNISKQEASSFRSEIAENANTSIDLVRR